MPMINKKKANRLGLSLIDKRMKNQPWVLDGKFLILLMFPPLKKESIADNQEEMQSIAIPRPINVLRIHLKAGLFRNGKIIAPQSAEQLINVTVIKPMRISSIIERRYSLIQNEDHFLYFSMLHVLLISHILH